MQSKGLLMIDIYESTLTFPKYLPQQGVLSLSLQPVSQQGFWGWRKYGERSKLCWRVNCCTLYDSLLVMHKLLVYAKWGRVHIFYFVELCSTDPKRLVLNLLLKREDNDLWEGGKLVCAYYVYLDLNINPKLLLWSTEWLVVFLS